MTIYDLPEVVEFDRCLDLNIKLVTAHRILGKIIQAYIKNIILTSIVLYGETGDKIHLLTIKTMLSTLETSKYKENKIRFKTDKKTLKTISILMQSIYEETTPAGLAEMIKTDLEKIRAEKQSEYTKRQYEKKRMDRMFNKKN